jgi:hypothetical protein
MPVQALCCGHAVSFLWFSKTGTKATYLSNRKQNVDINDNISESKDLKIQQGTILGQYCSCATLMTATSYKLAF